MKLFNLYIVSMMLLFQSCSEGIPLDDNLVGKISATVFEAGQSNFTFNSDNSILVNIFSKNEDTFINTCLHTPIGYRFFFVAQNTLDEQKLFLDGSSSNAFTITALNLVDSTNIIIKEGTFKILNIDSTMLKAEIDIKADENTYLSGVFFAELCI